MLRYINEKTNTQEEYGYACARIREKEKSLLNQEMINKMIESSSFNDTLKILAENELLGYHFNSVHFNEIDQHLNHILKDTIKLIGEISPDPFLLHLLHWKYDFQNLKTLLKIKYSEKRDESYPIYDIGNIKYNSLRTAVFEGKYQSIPIKIERMIKKSEEEYRKSEDLQFIDIILDQGYYEMIFDILNEVDQPFLFYYFKKEIDLLNFMTTCRCKVRHIKKSLLSDLLIKNGNYHPEKFIDIYENTIHSWANYFQKSEYSVIIENGLKKWIEEKSFLELERLSDNYLLEILKIGKYNTFGLESLVGYFYAKINDIKNIRMILNAKRYNLSKELIRKKIRETYV